MATCEQSLSGQPTSGSKLQTYDTAHAAVDTIAVRSFAFEQFSAAAAVLDSTGRIIDVNETWRLFAGLNDGPKETTGCGVNYLDVCESAAAAGDTDAQRVAIGLRQLLSGEHRHFDLEYPCPSPDQDRWFLLRATSTPVEHGVGVVLFHIDITARRLLENRLAALSGYDELTALPNRHSAERFLEARLAPALRAAAPIAAIHVDLDGLESVNDIYGQCVGDELLVQVALRAQRSVREGDLLGRVGANQFLLLCPGIAVESAVSISHTAQTVLAKPFQIGSVQFRVGASVGIAFSTSNSTVGSLLGAANDNMHADKHRRTASGDIRTIQPPEVADPAEVAGQPTLRNVNISHVRIGMIVETDVQTLGGNLLISAGTEVTETILHRLQNFVVSHGVIEPIAVSDRQTLTPT